MSQSPITVTYDIKELLDNLGNKIDGLERKIDTRFDKVDQRLEKLEEKVTTLEIGQTEMKAEIKAIDQRLTKLEDTQGKQGWTLITIIGGAVATGSIVALWRTFFTNNL